MADPQRARKMADRIKEVVARRLDKGLRDPRLGFVTITDVRVTGDLQHASVFYTVYGTDEERADSAAALKAATGMGAYTASKSGVARLTEALADELKGRVRVNAVLPSVLDTPANRADMGEADAAKWVTPQELANVIAFLLSDAASAVTGACIPVTGRV